MLLATRHCAQRIRPASGEVHAASRAVLHDNYLEGIRQRLGSELPTVR